MHDITGLRDSVLIQRDALAADDLDYLAGYSQRALKADSLVSRFDDGVPDEVVEWAVNREIRDTQEVQLTPAVVKRLSRIGNALVKTFINPFFKVAVRDREPPRILHYGVGGHYIPHVDAETLFKDDDGLEVWEKTLDRDLSLVCFLNDDFEGGELVFPTLDLTLRPQAGTLVCFPSDHNYIHGVKPVSSGHRYTLVTWMRVRGMPTPEVINAEVMDAYHRAWPAQIEQPPRVAKGGAKMR